MRTWIVLIALSLAAACGAPAPSASNEQPTLGVVDAWAAPTPGGVDVSAGYLTIANGTTSEDRLLSAASPRAERVELHEMSMDADVMRMRAIDGLAIPARSDVTLEPGGRHLMFFGVAQPFAVGEQIPVTLNFETAGQVDVVLPVRARAAAPDGGHTH